MKGIRKMSIMQSVLFKNNVFPYLQPINNQVGRIDVLIDGQLKKGKKQFNIRADRKKKDEKWELTMVKTYEYFYQQLIN